MKSQSISPFNNLRLVLRIRIPIRLNHGMHYYGKWFFLQHLLGSRYRYGYRNRGCYSLGSRIQILQRMLRVRGLLSWDQLLLRCLCLGLWGLRRRLSWFEFERYSGWARRLQRRSRVLLLGETSWWKVCMCDEQAQFLQDLSFRRDDFVSLWICEYFVMYLDHFEDWEEIVDLRSVL